MSDSLSHGSGLPRSSTTSCSATCRYIAAAPLATFTFHPRSSRRSSYRAYSRRCRRRTSPRPSFAQYRAHTAPSFGLSISSLAIFSTVSGSSTVSASIVSTKSLVRPCVCQPWFIAPDFLCLL